MPETDTQQRHSVAAIRTQHAARYMTQLCKHFEHKLPVAYGAMSGTIPFSSGTCQLRANAATLTLSLQAADTASLTQLQDVVARHLLRFAFREEMQIHWQVSEVVTPAA